MSTSVSKPSCNCVSCFVVCNYLDTTQPYYFEGLSRSKGVPRRFCRNFRRFLAKRVSDQACMWRTVITEGQGYPRRLRRMMFEALIFRPFNILIVSVYCQLQRWRFPRLKTCPFHDFLRYASSSPHRRDSLSNR